MQSYSGKKLAAAPNLASLAPWVWIIFYCSRHSGHYRIYTGQFFGAFATGAGLTAHPDHGLADDVALHAGTLLAVMAYFYRDVGLMLVGARDIVRRRQALRRSCRVLVIASLPVLLAGAVLVALGVTRCVAQTRNCGLGEHCFRNPALARRPQACTRSSDIKAREGRPTNNIAAPGAHYRIGANAGAHPGASRAGVTIMAGLFLGLTARRPHAFPCFWRCR